MKELRCLVEAVCLSTPATRVAKIPQGEAFLGPHGFVGDRHEGELSYGLFGAAPNQRQWSAVSTEEVEELCADIGVAPFGLGELGENLRLSGVHLAEVPPGGILELDSGARLLITAQNDPCMAAAYELSLTYGPAINSYFVRQAWGRRGVLGIALAPGVVKRGDTARLLVPEQEDDPEEWYERIRAARA